MKMVTAIVRPERLDDTVDALAAIGLDKLGVSEVTGVDGNLPMESAIDQEPGMRQPSPYKEIEVAMAGEQVPAAIAAIRAAAAEGKPGDGKIFVRELKDIIRIRSGERGLKAL